MYGSPHEMHPVASPTEPWRGTAWVAGSSTAWRAYTYRIANFSLGGLHIRSRSADSVYEDHEPLPAQRWTATAACEALGKNAHTIG